MHRLQIQILRYHQRPSYYICIYNILLNHDFVFLYHTKKPTALLQWVSLFSFSYLTDLDSLPFSSYLWRFDSLADFTYIVFISSLKKIGYLFAPDSFPHPSYLNTRDSLSSISYLCKPDSLPIRGYLI